MPMAAIADEKLVTLMPAGFRSVPAGGSGRQAFAGTYEPWWLAAESRAVAAAEPRLN
jgi:hypothetical protein